MKLSVAHPSRHDTALPVPSSSEWDGESDLEGLGFIAIGIYVPSSDTPSRRTALPFIGRLRKADLECSGGSGLDLSGILGHPPEVRACLPLLIWVR